MRTLLMPLSFLFGLIVRLRNSLYDAGYLSSAKLGGKVISIGNLAVGGTGKSPIVTDVANQILDAGGYPVILTRGYRSGLGVNEWQVLLDGQVVAGVSRHGVAADEALMQSRTLPGIPVVVGRKRIRAAQHFREVFQKYKITHWILDDGFQHRQIARDVDVVLLDARSPYGDLIPAGRFREPLSSLKRATISVITKSENNEQSESLRRDIRRACSSCEIFEARFVSKSPKLVSGLIVRDPERWGLVAGIAYPKDLLQAAKIQGISAHETLFIADHRPFHPQRLAELQVGCDAILTTEKDYARSQAVFASLSIPVFVLPLQVAWVGDRPRF